MYLSSNRWVNGRMWEPVFPMAWVYIYSMKYARWNVAQEKCPQIVENAYSMKYLRNGQLEKIWYNTYKSKQKVGASDGRKNKYSQQTEME